MRTAYTEVVVLSIQDDVTIEIRLREVMERYAASSGDRMTYAQLAAAAGVAPATIESIASRKDYNPTLKVLARLCVALRCTPAELLALSKPPSSEGKS